MLKLFSPVQFYLFALLLVLSFGCEESPSSKNDAIKIPKYNFSHSSITSAKNYSDCLESEDLIRDLGNLFETAVLETTIQINTDAERNCGDAFHKDIKLKYNFLNDNRLVKIKNILNKMLPHTEREGLAYEVFLIDSKEINAFTIPGGRIYVTTGILNECKNDHELANVIGHEIGHNENEHCKKIVQKVIGTKMVGAVTGDEIAQTAAGFWNLSTMTFNQPNEFEADQSGFYLSYKAGYDPVKGLEFWKRLSRKENQDILTSLFSSHPYSEKRYRCGREHLKKMQDKW